LQCLVNIIMIFGTRAKSSPFHESRNGRGCPIIREETCRIVYNRIPGTGSEILLGLTQKLHPLLNLRPETSPNLAHELLSENEQKVLARRILQAKTPAFIARAGTFIDFDALGERHPIWINVVRNPVDLLISRFYHFRQLWAEGVPRLFDKCVRQALEQGPGSSAAQACLPPTIQMHSFCGQHEDCFISPSMVKDQATKAALTESMRRRAETTVKTKYFIVGLTEHLGHLLRMLQKGIPQYFAGVVDLWKREQHAILKKYPRPTNATLALVEAYYPEEIAFYNTIAALFFTKAQDCGVLKIRKVDGLPAVLSQ